MGIIVLKACDLKKGNVVDINGQLYFTKNIDVKSPSSRGANTLYKVRFTGVQTKQKHEQTFTGDDVLNEIDLVKRQTQFLFKDGDQYTFMDIESYDQYILNESDISDEILYLTDGLEEIIASLVDDQVVGIELPTAVILEVIETAPAIKGGTAAARTKPATLSTGLIIQVPEYLANNEQVKVNTATGKFMSRA